ncbi:MAG: hypothetical protein A07HR67_01800 [uncultured archaeon A07HR67]|nr:MAG: hypothetical protein A07HR67_01800 [uncultured archaeon A07HR67]
MSPPWTFVIDLFENAHRDGTKAYERRPARPAYAAIDWPALPGLAHASGSTSRSPATPATAVIATENPLSRTVPVGFRPSSLTYTAPTPSSSASRSVGTSGVAPSLAESAA